MLLKQFKNNLKSFFSFIGITVTKKQNEYYDLFMYSEKNLPIVPKYINIGAGKFYHPIWHNLDIPTQIYGNVKQNSYTILHDLTICNELPFVKSSVQVFYISHVIEHLTNDAVQNLFNSVYNSLENNGVFRITCPDMDLIYDAYFRNDINFFNTPSPWGKSHKTIYNKFMEYLATDIVNNENGFIYSTCKEDKVKSMFLNHPKEYVFDFIINCLGEKRYNVYSDAHKHINWFNEKKIFDMLKLAGFSIIYSSKFGQSKKSILRNKLLFDNTVPELSLYVEAIK
jgi:predicted SAM-dependent methyltransferase